MNEFASHLLVRLRDWALSDIDVSVDSEGRSLVTIPVYRPDLDRVQIRVEPVRDGFRLSDRSRAAGYLFHRFAGDLSERRLAALTEVAHDWGVDLDDHELTCVSSSSDLIQRLMDMAHASVALAAAGALWNFETRDHVPGTSSPRLRRLVKERIRDKSLTARVREQPAIDGSRTWHPDFSFQDSERAAPTLIAVADLRLGNATAKSEHITAQWADIRNHRHRSRKAVPEFITVFESDPDVAASADALKLLGSFSDETIPFVEVDERLLRRIAATGVIGHTGLLRLPELAVV